MALLVTLALLPARTARAQPVDLPDPAFGAPVAPAPAGAPRVVGWTFEGIRIDPIEKLDQLVRIYLGTQAYYVESGDADASGTPIGTVPRLRQGFHDVGYHTEIAAQTGPGGVRLVINLRPYDRVRFILVSGNWPLRQDVIVRRLSIRAGQAVPLQGPALDAFLDSERNRILAFLQTEGYLDARVDIELSGRDVVPSALTLTVRLELGPGYPVGPVTVKGASVIPPSEVAESFRHRDWRFLWLRPAPFNQASLREDTTSLVQRYRALGYPAVRLLPGYDLALAAEGGTRDVALTLEINQRKHLDVVFEGNECCAESELRERLTFFTRGSADEYELEASRAALARFYRERGYMFVDVKARRERLSPEAERVVFVITQGPRLRVRGVRFSGQTRVPEAVLAGSVTVKRFPLLGHIGLGSGGYASLVQLENDANRIVDAYARMGYQGARARVEIGPRPDALRPLAVTRAGDDAKVWQNARALYVHFVVEDEGRRVSVGNISFGPAPDGHLPRDAAYMRRSIIMRRGQPFRESLVRQDGSRIIAVMRDDGYPYATAEPEIRARGDEVDVKWVVDAGPRVKVGPIFIRGNFKTRDNTILQWLPLRTGDHLTTSAFESGQRNLSLLQYFTNANPIRFPGQQAGLETVPMLIQVEERHDHLGSVRAGVGASTDQRDPEGGFPLGGFVSLGYEHGNLFGYGFRLRSRGDLGNTLKRAQADFEEPRLLGTMFRLQLSTLYLQQKTARLGDIESGSAVVGLARQVYPGVDAFLRYAFRDTTYTEFLLRTGGADEAQRSVRLGTVVGELSLGFEWLRLDNLLVPTQGFKVQGSIDLVTPAFSFGIGDNVFIKLHGRVLTVVPLTSRLSLRYSLRYDHGLPLDGESLLPKVERFFAGGDTTLRGYALDRARTEVIRAPGLTGVFQVRPAGGNLRVLSNLDLQYHLSGPLYVSVFLDSGAVENSLLALEPARFRHGAGISPLLVKLPIGDISVSWAWPLDPEEGDNRYGRLHFNVGLMF